MNCPMCKSNQSERYQSPLTIGGELIRRHRCLSCRGIYLTAQRVLSSAVVERLLTKLEISTRQTGSSSRTRGGRDGSVTRAQD